MMIRFFTYRNIFAALPPLRSLTNLRVAVVVVNREFRTLSGDAKKVTAKLPKRMPAVSLFIKDNYQSLKSANPGKSHREMFKLVVEKYKTLPPEQAEKYKSESEKSRAVYKKAREALSEKDKNTLLLRRRVNKVLRPAHSAQKSLKALKQEHGYPAKERGRSAFFRFLTEKSDSLKDENLAATERTAKVGRMWRELPDATKDRYAEAATKVRQQHQVAVDKWEADMKKKGLGDVVDKIKELSTIQRRSKVRAGKLKSGKTVLNAVGRPKKLAARGVLVKKRKSLTKSAVVVKRRPRRVGLKVKSVRKRLIKKSAAAKKVVSSSRTKNSSKKLVKNVKPKAKK